MAKIPEEPERLRVSPRSRTRRTAAAALVLGILLALVPTAAYAVPLPTGNATGTITDANGAAVVGASVSIYSPSDTFTVTTGATGQYTFTGVPAGRYQFAASNSPTHLPYPGSGAPAEFVDVPVSGTATKNAVLAFPSTVSGVISGATTVAGTIVYLEGVSNTYGVSNSPTGTDATGVYSFTLVPPGQYILHVQPPAGSDLVTEVYNNQRTVAAANLITLAPTGTTTTANASLETNAVQITGTATTGGPVLTSLVLTLFDEDQEFLAFTLGNAAAGTYSTAGILPSALAIYYVQADGSDASGNRYLSPITQVVLTGTDQVQNLTLALDPAPVVNGVADAYTLDQDTVLARNAATGVNANDTATPAGPVSVASLDDAPDHGDLFLAFDGSFRYAPDNGYVGTDTFVYRSRSAQRGGNLVTVTLNVRAVLPPTGAEVSPALLALGFGAFGIGAVLVVVAVRRRSANEV